MQECMSLRYDGMQVALKLLFPPLALLLLAAWVSFLASFALASLGVPRP